MEQNTFIIWYEGESFEIIYQDHGIDCVTFCQQLGPEGRCAMLDVLTCNYRQEVIDSLSTKLDKDLK